MLVTFFIVSGCTKKGLVADKHDEEYYEVPKLLPVEPVLENGTFIVYSDNQAGWLAKEKFLKKSNWATWKMLIVPFYQIYLLTNGIVGGIDYAFKIPDYGRKERLMVRDAIYAAAKNTQAAFILNLGDVNAYDGRRPSHWELFLQENKIEHPLVTEIPYLTVIGNHERANDTLNGFPNYRSIFGRPRFYVVEFSDAAIFVTDSNFIVDQYREIDDDLQDKLFEEWFVSSGGNDGRSWLERQLAACDKPFKIVAMHLSPLSCGRHYSDWLNPDNGRELPEKRVKLLDLFEQYNVKVVLSGHDHFYQHKILRSNTGEEMHFLIIGGGGVPLRDPYDEESKAKIHEVFEKAGLDVHPGSEGKIFHYLFISVNQEVLTVDVIEVTGDEETPTRIFEEISIEN